MFTRNHIIAEIRRTAQENGGVPLGIARFLAETGIKSSERESELGFVYLLKSGRYYKVGRSNAVGRRERELAIQLPEKAKLVHSIKTDDPVGIEGYWHNRTTKNH